jgi:carbon catabolite-derepressing protein kinase
MSNHNTPDPSHRETGPNRIQSQFKIGNYTLLQTLGVGSFGKVKLALHQQTHQQVAIKIINRKRIADMVFILFRFNRKDMVERVKREIRYLRQFQHPHIIKLYEIITTPTDILLVMELAGNELFNYIVDRGRMAEDEARSFFQQVHSLAVYIR